MSVGGGGCWLVPMTLTLAEAVDPLPPSVEFTALVTLFFIPVAIPETFTAKVHDALAARVAADRLTALDPAVAAIAPPPQLPVRPLGVVTTNPAGNVSVNPMPVKEAPVLGLERRNDSDVASFNTTFAAPNDFEIVGGRMLGGGGGPLEYPPPHAYSQVRPSIMTIQHERQRVCVGTFPLTPDDWPENHLPRTWGATI